MKGLREQIKSNGWRQGSILPPALCSQALERQGITYPSEPIALVVLTQDCDLLADKLDLEPFVEVILGIGPFVASRQLDRSNRQILIRLHGIASKKDSGFLVFRDKHRFRLPREWLAEHKPHPECYLADKAELDYLVKMVVRRFDRPALSDRFNSRLTPAFDRKKKGYRLLKSNHYLFRELRWSVPRIMEELPDGEDYDVEALIAILEPSVEETQAQDVLEEIQELIRAQCQGIDMGKPESNSRLIIGKPDVLTLVEYEALRDRSEFWDWEWLSRPVADGSD